MITGDAALDAWLTAHSHFIAAAIFFAAFMSCVLPGLAQALREDDQ